MPAPDLYTLIQQAEPLSEIVGYRFPSSLRRHYEKLRRFPEGYLVLGDALCSFDPVYGQGMSSAALQVALLDDLLQKSGSGHLRLLSRQFFQRAAKIIDMPWQSAVSEDFRFAGTHGPKPLGTNLINAYSALVQRATHTDTVVYSSFLKVMNLLAPPSSLFHPQIVWRVLRALWQGKLPHSSDSADLAMLSNGLTGESSSKA
jgi:2-polyprenyl-6-methoxyphenol hydroxylase-like FAD-dependent oxidoreductase